MRPFWFFLPDGAPVTYDVGSSEVISCFVSINSDTFPPMRLESLSVYIFRGFLPSCATKFFIASNTEVSFITFNEYKKVYRFARPVITRAYLIPPMTVPMP